MNTMCDSCKRIDFGRLLEVPAMELVPMFDRSLPYPIGSSEDFPLADEGSIRIWDPEAAKCPLCSLLRLSSGLQFEVAALPSFKRIDPNGFSLKSTSFTMGCGWSRGAADWANDCHKLVVVHANSRKTWHLKEKRTGFAVCLPKEREEAPLVPRAIPDKFDTKKARSWVRSCKKEHGYPCNETLLPVPGMRLIDCESRFIVDAEPKMLWVALSYVWGKTQSGTLSEGASKTVEDAIRVTKDLGYRYLWIDQFCIDQDDEIHKSSQIARMDAIYRGADLTIIAAAGQDSNYGLPGIGTSRRKEQQIVELDTCTILWTGPSPIEETMISTWCTRGWTFQEGLFSRRRLYFTDRQSWFECSDACWMEGMGGPRSKSLSDDIHATAGRPLALFRDLMIDQEDAVYHESTVGLRIFLKFITVYTQRSLKFDSDILAAFSGAANYLQSTGPRVSHILGLPYLGSMLDTESAENFMAYALCWVHDCETRRIPQFPSWTWAGWAGAVSWPHYSSTSEKTLVRSIRFEDDGDASSLDTYLRGWDQTKYLMAGLKVAICFEAQVISASLFSLRQISKLQRCRKTSWDSFLELTQESAAGDRMVLSGGEALTKSPSDANDNVSRRSDGLEPPSLYLTVGQHELRTSFSVAIHSPVEVIENLASSRWGSLLFGHNHNIDSCVLLIVEWLSDGSAQRIGMARGDTHRKPIDPDIFEDKDLSWRSVRLV